MSSTTPRSARARRGAARAGVSVASLLLGAAVVTHGSAQALAAATPAELVLVSCQSQQAAVHVGQDGVVLSGLGLECVGLPARADLTDATSGRVMTVRGRLQPVPGSTDLVLAVPVGSAPDQVQRVSVRLGG